MKINGLPVIDATENVSIDISKRDCDLGQTKDPGGCAAARAIMREFQATAARVHLKRTYVKVKSKEKGDHWLRFNTPQSMRAEIISFDRGAEFQPGAFTLYRVPKTHKLTGKQTGGKKGVRKKIKIARIKHHYVEGVRARGANR